MSEGERNNDYVIPENARNLRTFADEIEKLGQRSYNFEKEVDDLECQKEVAEAILCFPNFLSNGVGPAFDKTDDIVDKYGDNIIRSSKAKSLAKSVGGRFAAIGDATVITNITYTMAKEYNETGKLGDKTIEESSAALATVVGTRVGSWAGVKAGVAASVAITKTTGQSTAATTAGVAVSETACLVVDGFVGLSIDFIYYIIEKANQIVDDLF